MFEWLKPSTVMRKIMGSGFTQVNNCLFSSEWVPESGIYDADFYIAEVEHFRRDRQNVRMP